MRIGYELTRRAVHDPVGKPPFCTAPDGHSGIRRCGWGRFSGQHGSGLFRGHGNRLGYSGSPGPGLAFRRGRNRGRRFHLAGKHVQFLLAGDGNADLAVLDVLRRVAARRCVNPLPCALRVAVSVEFALAVYERTQHGAPAVLLQLLDASLRRLQRRIQAQIGLFEFRIQARDRHSGSRAFLERRRDHHVRVTAERDNHSDRRNAISRHFSSLDGCVKPKNNAEPRRTRRTRRKGKSKENDWVKVFHWLTICRSENQPHRFAGSHRAFSSNLLFLVFFLRVLRVLRGSIVFSKSYCDRTRSHQRAALNTLASAPGRPTIWMFTGRPLFDWPQGMDNAGKPQKLNGEVKRVSAGATCWTLPPSLMVAVPLFGGSTGIPGTIMTSASPNEAIMDCRTCARSRWALT